MPPPITLHSVKGSQLTIAEGDNNFINLDDRVTDLETEFAAIGGGIDHFEVDGAQFYVWLVDGSRVGPYALPEMDFSERGEWLAATVYFKNDLVANAGKLYRVPLGHTSAGSFDPNATDGLGNPLYKLWIDYTNPIGVSTVTGATYTLGSADRNQYLRFTNAAGCSVTLPAGVFIQDDEISLRQTLDAATVTIIEGAGVTINNVYGHISATGRRGAVVTLKLVDQATNTWDIMGLLAPAP